MYYRHSIGSRIRHKRDGVLPRDCEYALEFTHPIYLTTTPGFEGEDCPIPFNATHGPHNQLARLDRRLLLPPAESGTSETDQR